MGSEKLPIIVELGVCYKLWHEYLVNLPRHTRFTLGEKIDNAFVDCLEMALMAGYAAPDKKAEIIRRLSVKFDTLKFFLKLLWEIKALDNKKYSTISVRLNEIGKMIGGWMKFVK